MLLGSNGVIKSAMKQRGYKHRRDEDGFTITGEYAGNLQYVYSKECMTQGGLVVDLLYFGVDILHEKLVVGLFRENPSMEYGTYENTSSALLLKDFSAENLDKLLDKLIPSLKTKSI